jgi:hypothetical protein
LGVLRNLYQAGFLNVLWETCDITLGDFCHVLGKGVVKRIEVAAAKVFQYTQPPFNDYQLSGKVSLNNEISFWVRVRKPVYFEVKGLRLKIQD